MREIKFRGKKPTNGLWAYGSLVASDELNAAIYFQVGKGSIKQMEWVYVNPDTVGQFTGVTTSDGQEIWEGDIIHIPQTDFNAEMIGVVEFDRNAFIVRSRFSHCTSDLGWVCRKRMLGEPTPSVIGNIHDNPELLKGGE